jgi:hypothetical protein
MSSTSNSYTGSTTVNAGTLAVTGTLSGTTAVQVNTGGTLLLNSSTTASNIVGPFTAGGSPTTGTGGTSVTLDSGTLAIGSGQTGATHTFTSLSLNSNSTLDFRSSTDMNMVFSSFSGGAFTLAVTNWIGAQYTPGATTDTSTLGDGRDRLLFNTDVSGGGFGSAVSGITINGLPTIEVQFGSPGQYEIVPVPEPATTALIGSVALCALIGYRERRRFAGLRSRFARK